MKRLLLTVPILGWMWLAMMLTHELGHVFAAWVTGGKITSLEIRPGWLSHTLVQPSPHPSVVVWGGFLSGWIVPQLTAPLWRIERGLVGPIARTWAAFCLLAGGSYLALAGGDRFTDTGLLIAENWPHALLIAVGVAVAVMGYVQGRDAFAKLWLGLSLDKPRWSLAAVWWLFLFAWASGQWVLHHMLQPDMNVR